MRELVNYLHLEVLRQIVDEEWLLFRTSRSTPEGLDRLRRDHLELRLTIDLLTHATMSRELSLAQIVETTHHLLTQLTDHMVAEERLLGVAGAEAPAVETVGSQPHRRYDLTEGPVIDLDKLSGAQGRRRRAGPADPPSARGEGRGAGQHRPGSAVATADPG